MYNYKIKKLIFFIHTFFNKKSLFIPVFIHNRILKNDVVNINEIGYVKD